jgi:DNA-binding FadR family transcriptional regulator
MDLGVSRLVARDAVVALDDRGVLRERRPSRDIAIAAPDSTS